MSERRQTLIKTFRFTPETGTYTFSDPTKLTAREGYVTLKPDFNSGSFPTGVGVEVKTELHRPGALRQLRLFQAGVRNLADPDGNKGRAAKVYQLYIDNTRYYWDTGGSTWVAVGFGVGVYNTEAELSAHLPTFFDFVKADATKRGKFGVRVMLYTEDPKVTPEVHWLKVAYDVRIQSWFEDAILRTLAPAIRAGVRPLADFIYRLPATSATFNAASAVAAVGTPFNVKGVDAVYNRTDDAALLTDLLLNFNTSTNVVTLSAAQDANDVLQFGLIYEPEVVIEVSGQDFTEVAKVPAILIADITAEQADQTATDDYVLDRETNDALTVPAPTVNNLAFSITLFAPSQVDLLRMADAVQGFFSANPILTSAGTGEKFRLWLVDNFKNESRGTGNGIHTSSATARLMDVCSFVEPARAEFGVKAVKVTGSIVLTAAHADDADSLGDLP